MKRREFFKNGASGLVGATIIPVTGSSSQLSQEKGDRKSDKWHQMGTGKMGSPDRIKKLQQMIDG